MKVQPAYALTTVLVPVKSLCRWERVDLLLLWGILLSAGLENLLHKCDIPSPEEIYTDPFLPVTVTLHPSMPLCTYSPQGLQSTLECWALSNLVLFRGPGSLWGLWLLHQLSAHLLEVLSQEVLLFLAQGGSHIPPGQMDVSGLTLNGLGFITVSRVWCRL